MYILSEDRISGRLEIEGYVDTRQKYEQGFIMVGTLEEVEKKRLELESDAGVIYAVFQLPMAEGGKKIISKETAWSGNWRGNKYKGCTLLGEYGTIEEAERHIL